LALMVGCGCNRGTKGVDVRTIKPMKAGTFVAGPAVKPAPALLTWLEANARTESGARPMIRLPVVVHWEDEYRFGFDEVFAGSDYADRANLLKLQLDDGAMGDPIVDDIREACPKERTWCALWIDGHWGQLVEDPDFLEPGGGHPFAVRRIHEYIEGAAPENPTAYIDSD